VKPMLASDWDEPKVKLPVYIQPKIDGVRSLNLGHGLIGRSLKCHANVHTTNFFSQSLFRGFDGEMAAEEETNPALCRLTSSALSTITGEPWVMWHVFDFITEQTYHLPYSQRYAALTAAVLRVQEANPLLGCHLKLVPSHYVTEMSALLTFREEFGEKYEGSILRAPDGKYKEGRSTVREGGLLRIKDFVEEEAVVLRIVEGQRNENEATINPLGHTERSTHAANMVPNGMVGALECMCLKTKKPITVGAGSMPHDLRKAYFENQSLLVNKVIKYKTFLKGVKDKPRFPTFQSIRMQSDM
jgi:hypothetical protein